MFKKIKKKVTAARANKVDITVAIATREIGWEVVEHTILHHALADALRV